MSIDSITKRLNNLTFNTKFSSSSTSSSTLTSSSKSSLTFNYNQNGNNDNMNDDNVNNNMNDIECNSILGWQRTNNQNWYQNLDGTEDDPDDSSWVLISLERIDAWQNGECRDYYQLYDFLKWNGDRYRYYLNNWHYERSELINDPDWRVLLDIVQSIEKYLIEIDSGEFNSSYFHNVIPELMDCCYFIDSNLLKLFQLGI